MGMIKFIEANDIRNLEIINELAIKIWREHYSKIIGEEQVEYMLAKFQSVDAMFKQIEEEGYEYFLVTYNDNNAGYIGIKVNEDDLFLSKLYVESQFRKNGIAKRAIEFLTDICKNKHLDKIWLTVNKYNDSSVDTYKKLGFEVVREQVADIGGGYVMDDYIMEKNMDIVE